MSDEHVTKSGKVLSDEMIEALSAEAERGYDIADLAKSQIAPPRPVECLFCREEITVAERLSSGNSPTRVGTPEGPRYVHWQCGLREVIGGIGHLIAHDHWCGPNGDPDAGLTYRQSALLTAAWVEVVGLE